MSLFKYFEKEVKDGLPDPNGLLSSCVPSDLANQKVFEGLRSSYLLSWQHLKEEKVVHTIG